MLDVTSAVNSSPVATLSPLLKQAAPVVIEHASGLWITATDGRKYLDFTTGI
jgi:4-aminobutyrate aminotransferase